MLKSITGGRYTMRATLLHLTDPDPDGINPLTGGQWVSRQNPLTGEFIRVWEPVPTDNSATPLEDESKASSDIWCMARGIADGGIRAAATTETFGDLYTNIDIIHLWVPKKYPITKSDRVTNIRTMDGNILWRDEEMECGDIKATVFNVNGVVPMLDYRNQLIDNFCLLERAEV